MVHSTIVEDFWVTIWKFKMRNLSEEGGSLDNLIIPIFRQAWVRPGPRARRGHETGCNGTFCSASSLCTPTPASRQKIATHILLPSRLICHKRLLDTNIILQTNRITACTGFKIINWFLIFSFCCCRSDHCGGGHWCLLRCRARWSDLEKLLSQWAHLKGLAPVCFL